MATRGGGAALLRAAPHVSALRATAQLLNAPKAAPASPETGQPAGPALHALLDELAVAAAHASESGPEGRKDAAPLLARVGKLRALAEQADAAGKRQMLDALHAELGHAGPAPAATGAAPVQRVHDAVLIGGALVIIGGLGWLANRAWRYYQERQEDEILRQSDTDRDNFAMPGIPPELIAGVGRIGPPGGKVRRIFRNLNNFRFRYTGRYVNPQVAFGARQGDCQTLVGMFMLVCQRYDIEARRRSLREKMLVAPQPIHGRDALSNTEGLRAWYFDEHFWVEAAGASYDVLFMTTPPPQVILRTSSVEYRGIWYYVFSDGRCVIGPRENWDYRILAEGRVFANVGAARAFIDQHV